MTQRFRKIIASGELDAILNAEVGDGETVVYVYCVLVGQGEPHDSAPVWAIYVDAACARESAVSALRTLVPDDPAS